MNIKFISRLLLVSAGATLMSAQSQGTFASTGHLNTERMFHTATLLTTGEVLIAGGSAILAGWPIWSTAELYDPARGTFSPTGNMNRPRVGHTATLLPDGRVLIAGGDFQSADLASGNSAQASAELYDPATGTFAATSDMLVARRGHTATVLNTGKVLITGGFAHDAQGGQISLSSAELYDPLSGTFTATGSMSAGRAGHIAILLANGKVLIEGGNSCGFNANPELYDLATGQFTLTGASPDADLSPEAASLLPNGNVLTTLDYGCDFGNQAELYQSTNGTFAPAANMTVPRGYNTATLLPDGTVLIDGRDGTRLGGSAELFDPVAGTFTAANGTLPQSEEGHTATLLPNGSVLIAGGWICCGFSVATAELYHPAVLAPSPVLYSLPGGTQGAILHAGTHEIVSAANPAIAGESVEIYCAGLIDGSLIPPQVTIGGRRAEILFFGDAPGFASLNQVNIRVPDGLAAGQAIPVRLNYLNRPSNEVTISIQ